MTDIQAIYDLFLASAGICTDTRKLGRNDLFFALRGDNFDGNAFAAAALEKGASAAVIDDPAFDKGKGCVLVDDSLACLQELARIHRKNHDIPLIGLTGTNGKTTTKELIVRVLSKKYRVHATPGNFNNHIGVPLSILGIGHDTDIAVVEMGANHGGEIGQLCRIARPTSGLITNIGKAHLEGFGGYQGVIRAKTELYAFLREHDATVYVNLDDPLLMEHSEGMKRMTYGSHADADVRGTLEKIVPFLEIECRGSKAVTALYGAYNFDNIMAAICTGIHMGIGIDDVLDAVSAYRPDNSRSQVIDSGRNTLYLDAYNANPSSMQAGLSNFLLQADTNKMIILGDMLELGTESEKEHTRVLEFIRAKFHGILLVGPEFMKAAAGTGINAFPDTDSAAEFLEAHPPDKSGIFIKGSRGIALEKLLKYL